MEQYYNIAGLTVQMDSFGRTVKQAEPYSCVAAKPDIVIRSDWKALKQTQPHLSDEDCEYLCTGGNFYRQLLQFDGLLLHASAVVLDGKAYLFSAPCGAGKSTHTRLWLDVFGDRAFILNDDKPALRLVDGVWYAYGTPWSGKEDISTNVRVPLAGICFLHQSTENHITPITGAEAIPLVLEQTARPAEPESRIMLLNLLDKLLSQIPVWRMGCAMDKRAAQLAYNVMSSPNK